MKEFLNWKKQALTKLDKSPKGSFDERIEKLCNKINENSDMFTLSSCSGRVCLLEVSSKGKKESNFLEVTHDFANSDKFFKKLENYDGENKIYLRQESVIIHICVNSLEIASNLINLAKTCGFNQTGIISLRKITVEIICDVSLILPVYDLKILVEKEYFDYLIGEANKNQEKSWEVIDKFFEKV